MTASFDRAVLRVGTGDPPGVRLLAARCPACRAMTFPARDECASCGAATERVELPTTGTVQSHCTLAFPIPGARPPVTIVRVELDPQAIVQGVADAPMQVGDEAAVVTRTVEIDGRSWLGFGFTRSVSDG
jgi:uncharacterized OB-fold protein